MRRTILFAFFLLAACGGGAPTPDAMNPGARRQGRLFSAQEQALIAELAKTFSRDALDTCLNAWVTDAGGPAGPDGPISKPDVGDFEGFRDFLRECLGPVPGNARDARVNDARRSSSSHLQ